MYNPLVLRPLTLVLRPQSLIYLFIDEFFKARLQLVDFPFEHTIYSIFLMKEKLKVVEGKPRRLLLLFCLVHKLIMLLTMQSYSKKHISHLFISSNLPTTTCYFLPKCKKVSKIAYFFTVSNAFIYPYKASVHSVQKGCTTCTKPLYW